jgi:hypothetical protein
MLAVEFSLQCLLEFPNIRRSVYHAIIRVIRLFMPSYRIALASYNKITMCFRVFVKSRARQNILRFKKLHIADVIC